MPITIIVKLIVRILECYFFREKKVEGLNLKDREEEGLLLQIELGLQRSMYEYCLVRGFLTASVVHFPMMKNTMANLWHPLKGAQISDLGARRYFFRFFHEMDIDQVTKWTLGRLTITF
ncbi:hypothetical protein PVK06_019930 [Gossypium arboreum]|uniref:DUF4283 domain-containing protein n=1 Tax=Gossypium arboreum TaxID=29729 RepID=A0ABR0PLF7_GOSAR|nr:hypothetical protein PVK06_019930 [Gossypium arboreum]